MLSIQHLTVEIRGSRILHDVNLKIFAGTICSIVGQNGAGKSTLLRAILRVIPFQKGSITVQEQHIVSMTPKQLARHIAYLPQSVPPHQQCTVDDYILLGNYPWEGVYSKSEIQSRLFKAVSLCRISGLLTRIVSTLSGGEFQRVLLAQVIMQNAPVILLDEPTRFLDLKHQILFEEILLSLHKEGKTIINVTHDLYGALHLSGQAVMMKQGTIIQHGDPAAVINPSTVAEGFDVPLGTVVERVGRLQPFKEAPCQARSL